MGCENIIDSACGHLGIATNYILYNRNPDLMVGTPPSALRDFVRGDYATYFNASKIDLVVAAGSPEWTGEAHRHLNNMVLKHNLPYILMGIGTVDNNAGLTELDQKVLARSNTYIYTRSIEAGNAVNRELGLEKAEAQGCPAILASLGDIQADKEVVQIPQVPGAWQGVREDLLYGLDTSLPVIAERFDEWNYFSRRGFDVTYNYDPLKLLFKIGQYKRVVSTRLHGVIAGMSVGAEGVLVGKGDFRIESAARMYNIPVVANFEEALKTKGAIANDKFKVYSYYRAALTRHLKELFGERLRTKD